VRAWSSDLTPDDNAADTGGQRKRDGENTGEEETNETSVGGRNKRLHTERDD
jgi:hypothetical protein